MNAQELLKALSDIDDDLIAEANKLPQKRRYPRWIIASASVIIAILIGAGVYYGQNESDFNLEHSEGDVSVKIVRELPEGGSADCLAYLTEDELITQSETDIFRGTVADIQNVLISCGGNESYHAIIEVQVDQVYRTFGNCTAGDTVRVLTSPIDMDGFRVSTADTIEQLQIGMDCIFVTDLLDENDIEQHNGSTLYWTDLAGYKMPDGIRYAFLQTEDGLIFCRDAYPSFADAETLDDIARMIEKMIS